jgi:hypothetical protein
MGTVNRPEPLPQFDADAGPAIDVSTTVDTLPERGPPGHRCHFHQPAVDLAGPGSSPPANNLLRRTSLVELAESMQTARVRLRRLIETSGEVLAMVPANRLGGVFIAASRAPVLAALSNGTRMRTLYVDDVVHDAPSMNFIRDTLQAGAEARSMPMVPTWLTIIGREVVVMPRDPNRNNGVLLVRSGGHVKTALWFFDQAWEAASPLPNADTLSPWERRVLIHLVRGSKDETGARQLGVSARTYRRHVTELCERLGASSRFEAGVRAVRAGLV